MSACLACARLTGSPEGGGIDGTCEAYPDGIPHGILSSLVGHDKLIGDEVVPVAFKRRDVVREPGGSAY